MLLAKNDDPDERCARPDGGRAAFRVTQVSPGDPSLRAALREWDWVARSLLTRPGLSPVTRPRLEDSRRIVGELANVLAGEEPGEGTAAERTVWTAVSGGRIQAVAALFLCPGATFVELVATAPWNLLAPGDPADSRAVRGAGSALLAHAAAWSRAEGRGGRVALQAENPRARELYERLGFRLMDPVDLPLALVPRGERGFSPEILRVAAGAPGPDELRSPWMLLDPATDSPARARPAPVEPARVAAPLSV